MVMRKTPLKAWQLAMMRLGISFERQLKPFYSVVNDMAQEELICVGIGFGNAEAWFVDSDGYCMLQANDAEPPPKNGILRKALQCAAVFFLSLMVLIGPTSCNKDPQPTPVGPTPIDTITPVNPDDTIVPTPGGDTIVPGPGGDTIVPPTPGGDTLPPVTGGTKEYLVDFYLSAGPVYPSLDSVREWSNVYDTIYLRVRATSDAWTPGSFHVARDSLSPYFDVSSKVYGKGWWRMYQILDDSQLGNISVMGMIRSDSAYFASKGYGIYPQVTGKNAKSAQPLR